MKSFYAIVLISLASISCSVSNPESKHFFILAGQSNMVGLKPEESFAPAVEAEFGRENILIVKDASNGQPIRRWFKAWRPSEESDPEGLGDLYEKLISMVYKVSGGDSTKGIAVKSVTFIWMQGEQDAMEGFGSVYLASLHGLVDQLRKDLGRTDINMVLGRLSDYGLEKLRYPDWTMIRNAQVSFGETYERGAWVDTDDLNDGMNTSGNVVENDLHYSRDGYRVLGQRFADAAISLINNFSDKPLR